MKVEVKKMSLLLLKTLALILTLLAMEVLFHLTSALFSWLFSTREFTAPRQTPDYLIKDRKDPYALTFKRDPVTRRGEFPLVCEGGMAGCDAYIPDEIVCTVTGGFSAGQVKCDLKNKKKYPLMLMLSRTISCPRFLLDSQQYLGNCWMVYKLNYSKKQALSSLPPPKTPVAGSSNTTCKNSLYGLVDEDRMKIFRKLHTLQESGSESESEVSTPAPLPQAETKKRVYSAAEINKILRDIQAEELKKVEHAADRIDRIGEKVDRILRMIKEIDLQI